MRNPERTACTSQSRNAVVIGLVYCVEVAFSALLSSAPGREPGRRRLSHCAVATGTHREVKAAHAIGSSRARTVRPLHTRLIWTASGGAVPSSIRTSPDTITTISVCARIGAMPARVVREITSARTRITPPVLLLCQFGGRRIALKTRRGRTLLPCSHPALLGPRVVAIDGRRGSILLFGIRQIPVLFEP